MNLRHKIIDFLERKIRSDYDTFFVSAMEISIALDHRQLNEICDLLLNLGLEDFEIEETDLYVFRVQYKLNQKRWGEHVLSYLREEEAI